MQAVKKDEIEALYVQTAIGGAFKEGVLSLNSLAPTVLWFSDRPDRDVGHVKSEEFLNAWGEGKDSFANDPLNIERGRHRKRCCGAACSRAGWRKDELQRGDPEGLNSGDRQPRQASQY